MIIENGKLKICQLSAVLDKKTGNVIMALEVIFMVIWNHAAAGYGYLSLLLALFFLTPLVMLILYLRQTFLPAVRDPENKHWLARLLLSIPIVILLIPQVFALRIPIFFVNFFRAEHHVLRGEVELVSYAEDWARGFNGYTVILTVDGETFSPTDAVPQEVLERLTEGGQMEITYVMPKGDEGTYIWEIKSIP